jgi:hypothetical protein
MGGDIEPIMVVAAGGGGAINMDWVAVDAGVEVMDADKIIPLGAETAGSFIELSGKGAPIAKPERRAAAPRIEAK